MSALTPHIRVLRAEPRSIDQTIQSIVEGRQSAMPATYEMLCALRDAKIAAADALEAAEPKVPEDEHPITYDPKGKR